MYVRNVDESNEANSTHKLYLKKKKQFVFRFKSKKFGALLLVLFYSEFVSYWTLPWTWYEHPNCPPPHCKKLLLISDPQIVGPEWRWLPFMDTLSIWDSDRYLRRTFQSAFNYLKPDLVVFLGDLIDQGHIATDREFSSYLERLKSIYGSSVVSEGTKVILIPGDNDIGGFDDILLPGYVKRFNKMFNQTEECTLTEFIEFCKVNLMTVNLQQSRFINGDLVRIALSHIPLISRDNYYLTEVIKKIRPQLIFAGHLHTSFHYTAYETDVWDERHKEILPSEKMPKMYKFHEGLIHEIIVPTCSYRMGVYNMGYGAAFIDTKKRLFYFSVLWLPHRFLQLLLYTTTLVGFLLFCFYRRIKRNLQRKLLKSPQAIYASLI